LKEIRDIEPSEIVKNIKKKKNGVSYVSIYWSLAHQKMISQCFPLNKQKNLSDMSFSGMEAFS